jgi:anti-anti-sigma factor
VPARTTPAHRFRDALVEAWASTRQPVAVHLGGVRFFDSYGLHAVVTAWRVISADGGQLYLASASGPVRRILAMTGTDVLLGRTRRFPDGIPSESRLTSRGAEHAAPSGGTGPAGRVARRPSRRWLGRLKSRGWTTERWSTARDATRLSVIPSGWPSWTS